MIVNIRGTNGSGKSTLVRTIMEDFGFKVSVTVPQRRKPVGYICLPRLFVVGHYEIANGGIDTLRDLDYAYYLIRYYYEAGYDVIAEGKNRTDSPKRIEQMHKEGKDVRVVIIDHPVQECIASVRQRGHTIKESTIIELHEKCQHEATRFSSSGVSCVVKSRTEALQLVRQWLRVPLDAHQ